MYTYNAHPTGLPNHLLTLFFFNDTAPTEIYTLSLHDALPIYQAASTLSMMSAAAGSFSVVSNRWYCGEVGGERSEEHTSELQSRQYLVCRLLLEKKKEQISDGRALTSSHQPQCPCEQRGAKL